MPRRELERREKETLLMGGLQTKWRFKFRRIWFRSREHIMETGERETCVERSSGLKEVVCTHEGRNVKKKKKCDDDDDDITISFHDNGNFNIVIYKLTLIY